MTATIASNEFKDRFKLIILFLSWLMAAPSFATGCIDVKQGVLNGLKQSLCHFIH
jgi:hypothetical protein